MKIRLFSSIPFQPASHEDLKKPGVYKKVLYTFKDFGVNGNMQMINWASLRKGQSFKAHYHEDMDEIFIIISGSVQIKLGSTEVILEKGDSILIPAKISHKMINNGKVIVNYLVIGVSYGKKGRTILNESSNEYV